LKKFYSRTPRNYDGSKLTAHALSDVLPIVLRQIGEVCQSRPDLILAAWPDVIGEKLASMAVAVSFESGILFVKVKNSTLLSLLSQRDKPKILKSLRDKFPKLFIKNIVFRLG
jgi:hypothetical protein